MRKLLLVLVLTAFVLSGCMANSADSVNSENPDAVVTGGIDNGKVVFPDNNINNGYEIPRMFKNEEQLVAAIKGDLTVGLNPGQGDLDNLNNTGFYFVPETMPEGATLSSINVKDFYIALFYTFDGEPDPYMERTFIFEWYRTMGPGDIEKDLRENFSGISIEKNNDYNIIKVKPSAGYEGDKQYVCQEVFWEQGGCAFHVLMPISFTKEDIAKYCVAKKVVVE